MRCNLAFRLAALLAATVIVGVNSLSFSASSTPENTIASNGKCGCDHPNSCFPCPDDY